MQTKQDTVTIDLYFDLLSSTLVLIICLKDCLHMLLLYLCRANWHYKWVRLEQSFQGLIFERLVQY